MRSAIIPIANSVVAASRTATEANNLLNAAVVKNLGAIRLISKERLSVVVLAKDWMVVRRDILRIRVEILTFLHVDSKSCNILTACLS